MVNIQVADKIHICGQDLELIHLKMIKIIKECQGYIIISNKINKEYGNQL